MTKKNLLIALLLWSFRTLSAYVVVAQYTFPDEDLSSNHATNVAGFCCAVSYAKIGCGQDANGNNNFAVLNGHYYHKITHASLGYITIRPTSGSFLAGDHFSATLFCGRNKEDGFRFKSTTGNVVTVNCISTEEKMLSYTLTANDINSDGSLTLYRYSSNCYVRRLSVRRANGDGDDEIDEYMDGGLVADGSSSGTYSLINNCGYEYETPDVSRDHASSPFQHIQQEWDNTLGKNVFAFYIHADIDDDRGLANVTDRQRNEIKTGPNSPASLIAQEGQRMVSTWKFKLPAGFQTTTKFSHIHQLKGIDNSTGTADVGLPLITFTCYSKSNGSQVLRLRYNNRNDASTVTLAEAPLSNFLGQWVEVVEMVKYGASGSYQLTIRRLADSQILLSYQNDNLDMWRTDCAGLRPKWGIYRYIGENRSWEYLLRDEKLLYADFYVLKVDPAGNISMPGAGAVPDVTAITSLDKDGSGSPNNAQSVYTLDGRLVSAKTGGLPKGVYIQNHRLVIVK